MDFQQQIAVRTLLQESRGEPLAGQQAVAWVLRNRVSDGRWGNTLASVCLWHAAFSGWWCPRGTPAYHDPNFAYACGLPDDDPVLIDMGAVMDGVMALDRSADPTNGAMWYFADSMALPPAWATAATFCGQFGKQKFYKGVK